MSLNVPFGVKYQYFKHALAFTSIYYLIAVNYIAFYRNGFTSLILLENSFILHSVLSSLILRESSFMMFQGCKNESFRLNLVKVSFICSKHKLWV